MEQTFKSKEGDSFLIKITKEFISFYLNRNGFILGNIPFFFNNEDEAEDEEGQSCFYWIGVEDWINSYNKIHPLKDFSWQEAMLDKRWYTQEMNDFINKTLIKN